jgi:hypothetical protein
MLVETGFITNPEDANKLKSHLHQKRIARSIFTGIRGFFYNNPPLGTIIAQKASEGTPVVASVLIGQDVAHIHGFFQSAKSTMTQLRQAGICR